MKPFRNATQTRKRNLRKPAGSLFDDLPELKQARSLWVENRLLESVVAFERIVERHPANIPALIDASRALGKLYRHARAETLLDRATELGMRSSRTMLLAGQSYRLMRRNEKAIACFLKAMEIEPGQADVHLELAILYERQHNLLRALEHCQTRLELIPGDGEASFLMARIYWRMNHADTAIQMLERLVQRRTLHWTTRSRACTELARINDANGCHDAAWSWLFEGKRGCLPYARQPLEKRNRVLPALFRLSDTVAGDDIESWRALTPAGDQPRPVLLTGIPRSGTTLLEQILYAHPDIAAADEFDVFPRICFPMLLGKIPPEKMTLQVLNAISPDRIDSVEKSYVDMLVSAVPEAGNAKVLIDKNPGLLPLVLPYLRSISNGRLIVCIRDPRDVLISCLLTYMPLNDFSVDMLDIAIAVERIGHEVSNWIAMRSQLPPGLALEIKYEDLISDMAGQSTRVLEFLGLEWSANITAFRESTDFDRIHSPSYVEVAKPVHSNSVGRWEHYRSQLQPYTGKLQEMAELLGYRNS